METEKRFVVQGKQVLDRMNGNRVAVECEDEEEAALWAITANDHHEKALKGL